MGPTEQLRVGLCGIGLEAYWAQFAGLKAKLEAHVEEVAGRVRHPGIRVVNLGLIDTPTAAREAAHANFALLISIYFLFTLRRMRSAALRCRWCRERVRR